MNKLGKYFGGLMLMSLLSVAVAGQGHKDPHTLLWKISGNGIGQPSYLFGTIHMLCADDAQLSDSMKQVIRNCDEVYFEVDMDNIVEMLLAMNQMKMKGDTTLRDLLTDIQYKKVKDYFDRKGSMLPFSMLETYKPILAASTLEQKDLPCDNTAMMEQVIMEEAKASHKKIQGLETMSYQAGVLDAIPYKLQAEQLVSYIDSAEAGSGNDKMMQDMFRAYKEQDLQQLEKLMVSSDAGLSSFTDVLLYNRNRNWVEKLGQLLPRKSLLIAVGAGHLPGEKGLISLLRKQGYTVTPVNNRNRTQKII